MSQTHEFYQDQNTEFGTHFSAMTLVFSISPNKEKELKRNSEKIKSLKEKTLSNEEHVTDWILRHHAFHAEAFNSSMLPKKGRRVSSQLQFEKRRGANYPISPAQVTTGTLHDHEDPLLNQLQHMPDLALRKYHDNKRNKWYFSAIGCKPNDQNFQERN